MNTTSAHRPLTLSIDEVAVIFEYLGGVGLPSLSLAELQQLPTDDWRLLRAAARRALQARELLSRDDLPQLNMAELTILTDCLRTPICDTVLVQSAETTSLTAYYQVGDGSLRHETLSVGLHRFSRCPDLSSRTAALMAVGTIAYPIHNDSVTLSRDLFGNDEQTLLPDELAERLAPLLPAAAVAALITPTRTVTLQRVTAQPDAAATLQTLILQWHESHCWAVQPAADNNALTMTPLSPAAITPLIDAHFS